MQESLLYRRRNDEEQKKRRRIIFFWLLFFLLLAAVIIVPIVVTTTTNSSTTTVVTTTTTSLPTTTPAPPIPLDPFPLVRFHNYLENFKYIDYGTNGTYVYFILVTPNWNVSKPCFQTAPMYSYAYLSIDDAGNHYVTASCLNNMGMTRSFIYKYNNNGVFLWEREYDDYEFSLPQEGRFVFNNSMVYTMKQTPVGASIWKLDGTNGDFLETSLDVNNLCSSLPDYDFSRINFNIVYALNRISFAQYVSFLSAQTTCIQTFNAFDLSLEFVNSDTLTDLNPTITLDVDRTNGNIYYFSNQISELGPGTGTSEVHLLSYDRDGNFLYIQSFYNTSFYYRENLNYFAARKTTTIVNNTLYWIGTVVDEASEDTLQFVNMFNITDGNRFRDVYLVQNAPIVTTSPFLFNNSIYYGITEDIPPYTLNTLFQFPL